jgi:tetratricopeptide (TPR) repeat protein
VLIAGEAGIGKSRLVHQLRERLRETPHTWLECRSSPYTEKSAFYPVIELLEGALDFGDEHSPEEKLGKLERGLAHAGVEPTEAVSLFASLLSLRLPERYAPLEISPQLQRQKTLAALLTWLLALGEKQPLVLVAEDLHWTDPSTLEWLGLLIEQCPTASVLLLLTFRPDFEPPWPLHAHLQPIALNRLRRREARILAADAISGVALPEALLDTIAERSDGVPLFVEELAKGVMDTASERTIPETLQDSLTGRLDRLGAAKQVAQLGAALGREFPYALLEAVVPMKAGALQEGLARLVEAELVYQRGLPPGATYTFKHALVQDSAYESLLESQRRELHGRIADALEQRFAERVAREPERLARHCEKAGRVEDAIAHYQRAAESATQRFAQAEAIAHLNEAIALLGTLAASPERKQQELQLQIALGSSIFSARGGGDPEAERAFGRARELCAEARESPALMRALLGLSLFHFSRGEISTSCELAEQALALADRGGEVYPRLVAHTRLGVTFMYLSQPERSLEHLECAVELYDPAEHRVLAAAWGQDWGTNARSFAAIMYFSVGRFDRARRLMAETLALAREGDPYSLGFALAVAATLHWLLGERAEALERADEAVGIGREQGFPLVSALAGSLRGVALGGSRGIEEVEAALQRARTLATIGIADHCQRLAQVNLEAGRTEAALAAVQQGFECVREEYLFYAPRLHHTRGQILLQQGDVEGADRSFRRALELSRERGSKAWELNIATSLARLLRDRGRAEEARALLQPVYDWFTEGFDTPHLKDAKALLDELA